MKGVSNMLVSQEDKIFRLNQAKSQGLCPDHTVGLLQADELLPSLGTDAELSHWPWAQRLCLEALPQLTLKSGWTPLCAAR